MATAPVRRLDQNGDMTFGRGLANYATGGEAAEQRLYTRMRLLAGEWFLDTDAGVPWWQPEGSGVQAIMGVPRNDDYIAAVLKTTALGSDGVASLVSFALSFDSSTRRQGASGVVKGVDGDLIPFEVVSP